MVRFAFIVIGSVRALQTDGKDERVEKESSAEGEVIQMPSMTAVIEEVNANHVAPGVGHVRSISTFDSCLSLSEKESETAERENPEVLQSVITNSSASAVSKNKKRNPWDIACNAERYDAFSHSSRESVSQSSISLSEHGALGEMDDSTKLRFAVHNGALDVLHEVLDDLDCDPGEVNVDGSPIFLEACSVGKVDIVKALLLRPPVNLPEIWSGAFAGRRRFRDVQSLAVVIARKRIKRKPSASSTLFRIDKTALRLIFDFLLPAQADVNMSKHDGVTGLFMACAQGHLQVVKQLLSHPKINVNKMRSDGVSPLRQACANDHRRIAQLLLDHPRVDVSLSERKLVESFLVSSDQGNEFELPSSERDWQSIDDVASERRGHASTSEKGSTVDATGPLVHACRFGSVGVVRQMLRHTDIDHSLQHHWLFDRPTTPLLVACQSGDTPEHVQVLKELLVNGDVDVNEPGHMGETPLAMAIFYGNLEIVKQLLRCKEIDINKSFGRDDLTKKSKPVGSTPLLLAIALGHFEIGMQLLAHKEIEINKSNAEGITPLWKAAADGNLEIVRELLSRKDVAVNEPDNDDGQTPLLVASAEGHSDVVAELLFREDVEINKANHYEATALHAAVHKKHLEIVRRLLSCKDIAVNATCKPYGLTPLLVACVTGNSDMVGQILSNKKTNVNKASNIDGQTPLYVACTYGRSRVVVELLSREDIEINTVTAFGATPLYIACLNGHADVVKLLLAQKKTDINKANEHSVTPLHAAVKQKHLEVVRHLLSRKDIFVNVKKSGGWTPLHLACENGSLDIVEEILSHQKTDINQASNNGAAPVLIACQHGHLQIVRRLLSHPKILINQATKDGATSLYFASQNGHLEIVTEFCTRAEIEINPETNSGATPLFMACHEGHLQVVKQLLSHKQIQINKATKAGHTPLYIASQQGHQQVVEVLRDRLISTGTSAQDVDAVIALGISQQDTKHEQVPDKTRCVCGERLVFAAAGSELLERRVVAAAKIGRASYKCDLCKNNFPANGPRYIHDPKCDYDVCNECFFKAKILRNSQKKMSAVSVPQDSLQMLVEVVRNKMLADAVQKSAMESREAELQEVIQQWSQQRVDNNVNDTDHEDDDDSELAAALAMSVGPLQTDQTVNEEGDDNVDDDDDDDGELQAALALSLQM